MVNVLVQLSEINNLDNSHTLHIDKSFKTEDLQTYLNTINNTNELYTFYIDKEILKTNLETFMTNKNITDETKIFVEYEIEKNKYDEEIDLEGHISCMGVCKKRNGVVLGIYKDDMKIYEKNEIKNFTTQFDENKVGYDIRIIEQGIAYSKKHGLIDFESCEKLVQGNITAIHKKNDKIFYGLENGELYELSDTTKLLLTSKAKIVKILSTSQSLLVFVQNGDLHIFNDHTKCIKHDYQITTAEIYQDKIFIGTSTNKLIKRVENEEMGYNVDIRYIDHIRVINENVLIISGQYIVQVVQLEPYRLINEFKFREEVSGIEYFEGEMFISTGSKIYKKRQLLK
ncbi:ribosome biogenesis protein YTM1 [Vairimorpha necatrix]|uniref:Ribosome biogenesis protein YTM1 n=1 Tax=Vairimorpha necatrix TaxID=6039 RepID=A0AAX4JC15_9MICR